MIGATWFHKQSFQVKISILMTFASSLVLAVVSGCIILVEIGGYKKDLLREQRNMLEVVGTNLSAPLVFDDALAIRETLAIFEKLPDTESVVLYSHTGYVVSRFDQIGSSHRVKSGSIDAATLPLILSDFKFSFFEIMCKLL